MGSSIVVICFLAAQFVHGKDSLEDAWRRDHLDDGRPYWWRPTASGMEPEISLEKPSDAWNLGRLDNGSPYLWRRSASGNPNQPELQLWEESFLDDGKRYWWRLDENGSPDVSLVDPHQHAEPDGLLTAWSSSAENCVS
uniref:Uncharacterized protein n=1 Tax=Chrysotila carterae TaxID=13221 RepID=A0A7S4F070_CHRCT|eukprot:6185175-Pleurochrysis_carterae.AAC.9